MVSPPLTSNCWSPNYDIAAANLAAAVGLLGAEPLNIDKALGWLDGAANQVHKETLRHAYQFHERPQDFENSPAYFCMLALVTVLRLQLGVRYNPARIRDPKFQDPHCFDPDFSDSRDLFIHGMIGGPGGRRPAPRLPAEIGAGQGASIRSLG
jgi:hypothetical protein